MTLAAVTDWARAAFKYIRSMRETPSECAEPVYRVNDGAPPRTEKRCPPVNMQTLCEEPRELITTRLLLVVVRVEPSIVSL